MNLMRELHEEYWWRKEEWYLRAFYRSREEIEIELPDAGGMLDFVPRYPEMVEQLDSFLAPFGAQKASFPTHRLLNRRAWLALRQTLVPNLLLFRKGNWLFSVYYHTNGDFGVYVANPSGDGSLSEEMQAQDAWLLRLAERIGLRRRPRQGGVILSPEGWGILHQELAPYEG